MPVEGLRVLIAKPGLDGHEAGAKLVARALRDAGMEIVYLGPRQTPESIVQAALQEDADLIGLSILSGSHNEICSRLAELLDEKEIGDIPVVVGGIIPPRDQARLAELGVRAVFTPGSDTRDIASTVTRLAAERKARKANVAAGL